MNRRHAELKARYADLLTERQGLRDQLAALEVTKSAVMRGSSQDKKSGRNSNRPGDRRKFALSDCKMPNSERLVEKAEQYNGNGGCSAEAERSGESEEGTMREDMEVVGNKISHIARDVIKLGEEIKEKKEELEECEAEVEDHRLHWDMLQTQVGELAGQLGQQLYEIEKGVGEKLRKDSQLSIDMYHFVM